MAIISDTFESTYMLKPIKYPDFIPNKSNTLLATTRHSCNFNNDKHLSAKQHYYLQWISFLFLGRRRMQSY